MIELPEAYVLAEQINETLVGKVIRKAVANTHPHGFAMYSGDPAAYNAKLCGKRITAAATGTGECGDRVEILCEDMLLVISTPIKYHAAGAALPKSHQLLLQFDDGSHLSCTVQMWGSMLCMPLFDRKIDEMQPPDPFSDEFDEHYFDVMWNSVKPSMSAKAFLATEQRIPGLGNGVLQDILFSAGIHPKRKLATMSDEDKSKLYRSVKETLALMRVHGGRDTEKDLFNRNGGYETILSKNTMNAPCRVCGSKIERQNFMGGNIYFCTNCQPL
jgi:formamidopyrimidine-DNA glycosylase